MWALVLSVYETVKNSFPENFTLIVKQNAKSNAENAFELIKANYFTVWVLII